MRERSTSARFFATILALVGALALAALVPLPGLDSRAFVALPGGFWPWATGRAFSLGMTPFFAAAFVGYLWIHVAPSWRHLETAAVSRFQRTLFIIALGWALLFAYPIVRSVNAITPLTSATKVIWILLLVGSVALLGLLAKFITKSGMGNGAALFLASSFAREVQDLQELREISGSSGSWFEWLVAPCVIAVCTAAIWIFQRRDSDAVRAPTAGMIPVVIAYISPTIATALALFGMIDARHAAAMTPGTVTFSVVAGVSTLILTFGLSYVWNRFARTNDAVHVRRSFRSALWISLGFGLIFIARPLAPIPNAIDPLMVVVVVAVGFDFVAEIVFRRSYGQLAVLRSEFNVDGAKRVGLSLRQSGVPVLLRGEFFLTVTRVFGLLTPIDVMVPEHHAEAARKICADFTS